jgi:hypothetical protein
MIIIDWDQPISPENGDSNILSYELVWDANTSIVDQALTSVTNYYSLTSFTVTEGLV